MLLHNHWYKAKEIDTQRVKRSSCKVGTCDTENLKVDLVKDKKRFVSDIPLQQCKNVCHPELSDLTSPRLVIFKNDDAKKKIPIY